MRDLPSWREIVSRYNLKLTRAGASLRGPCPLHGGKNPTAFVITEGRGFYCHSCGENGGVLRFLELMRDPEATEWAESRRSSRNATCVAKTAADASPAVLRSQEALPEVAPLGPLDSAHPTLRARGVSVDVAMAFGCGFFGGSGPMHGRIVFPVHDAAGRLVGHVGRVVGAAEPRYRFSKGLRKSLLLYNEHRIDVQRDPRVIVVEGVFDVLAVHDAGFPNVVSTLGCQISATQMSRLRAFPRVAVLFDDDDAGRDAADVVVRALRPAAVKVALPAADPANIRRSVLAAALSARS